MQCGDFLEAVSEHISALHVAMNHSLAGVVVSTVDIGGSWGRGKECRIEGGWLNVYSKQLGLCAEHATRDILGTARNNNT